ncbi:nitrate/sulfonate/bicarbonate ABC transporter substrate-binding protein [Candidatus Vecturithrix granuli]|uniref:Nitrate/sulfonate/bicarbonate ABC transporter substrate-binding protein n=1 Tax=Vecturithrix granuli TaxID=1499967 RepID=A0A0S6W687_VECG1|nr:nitrate/sulfonate/bicarbonate ABC transporter substrate-binding protein [Candidatus Vecturithrix granuli]
MEQMLIAWGTKNLNTSAQLVLAKRLGFFRQEGIQIQCRLFPSEEDLFKAFTTMQEKPLIWVQTAPDIFRLQASGFPIRIIAPLADISASYQVILRENAGIVLPGDLEGRKIGIVRDSLIDLMFRNMARDFSLDLGSMEFINAAPVRQLELFAAGQLDVVACWEPWASQACYMGGHFYFSGLFSKIPGHEGPVNWLTGQSLLATYADHLHADREQLFSCLKAIKKATDYLNTTVQKAVSILSDLLSLEHDELAELLQKNLYSMKMDETFQIGLSSARDLFTTSALEHVPAMTELYTAELLAQLDASLVSQTVQSSCLPSQGSASSQQSQILAEGNIYYAMQARIQRSRSVPLRYIIVDDTRVVLDVFATIVDMLDGQVVGTASTGAEGVVLYVDQLPDVVVMDISMPDMNGIEAIKSIFKINPAANVIVISGNDYEEIRQRVFELGVKVFIGKPFHVEQILTILHRLLS